MTGFTVDQARATALAELCRARHVAQLDLFGSAIGERFDPAASDVDLLVSFADVPMRDFARNWLALADGLALIFGRPIDLIDESSLENPYFRGRVMATKQTLFPPP